MAICKIFTLGLAALVFAGFQDPAQLDRWVAELVHPNPEVSRKAEKELLKAGPKALPALKAAFESKTPELGARARYVAGEIERFEFEKQRDAQQRPRRLEIVTLQIKDAPLSEALKTLGGQVDSTFHTTVDGKQKLTIDVKEVPLRKCLDQMEDALKATIVSRHGYHNVVKGVPARKKRAYVPGATFEFSLSKFQADGQPAGYSLMTDITGPTRVFVDAFEVTDAQKGAVEVERCGRCSPRFVRFKTEKPGPFTVKLKGRVVWESPYEFAIADPAKPQDFKVGPFSAKYEWPKVTWASEQPVPEQLIGRVEFNGKLKKQFQGPGKGGSMGVAVTPPLTRQENAWCACANGPVPFQPAPPVKLGGNTYYEGAFRMRKPEQFESLKVRFYKGIEENFETEAQVTVE